MASASSYWSQIWYHSQETVGKDGFPSRRVSGRVAWAGMLTCSHGDLTISSRCCLSIHLHLRYPSYGNNAVLTLHLKKCRKTEFVDQYRSARQSDAKSYNCFVWQYGINRGERGSVIPWQLPIATYEGCFSGAKIHRKLSRQSMRTRHLSKAMAS